MLVAWGLGRGRLRGLDPRRAPRRAVFRDAAGPERPPGRPLLSRSSAALRFLVDAASLAGLAPDFVRPPRFPPPTPPNAGRKVSYACCGLNLTELSSFAALG